MPRTFPGGATRRRLHHYGEALTLVSEDISNDTSTDWDDATVNTSQVTATGVVQVRGDGEVARNERGDEVTVDAVGYVDDEELGGFSINGGGAGGPTKVTTAAGAEYLVVVDDLRPNGVHELTLTRT